MIKTIAIFGASQAGLAGAVEVLERTMEPLTLGQLSQLARAARAFQITHLAQPLTDWFK